MDAARCTLDDVVYQSMRFAALPPNELARKRIFLVCPECRGPAFFRKASCSGQAACFGARPHEEGCRLAASEYEQNDIGTGDDQDVLENPGQRIVLDFNFGASNDRHNDPDAPVNAGGRGGRFVGGGARPDAAMHRRLSTILRNLMMSGQFRTSRQIVEIAGVGEFTVGNFFVPFGTVAAVHDNQYRGYWGMVVSARFGQTGALWLNSGGRDDMSVCVPEQFVNELYERFRITDEEDLAGIYALVLGTLRTSQGGKKYVQVEDLGFITLR
jgi:hypothetical protein